MEKIIKGRGQGKTLDLIKKSSLTGDYIVCSNFNNAAMIQCEAQEHGLNIPFPITYYEFTQKKYYSKGISGFLIDNVEMFLESLTDVPINAITFNT